MPTSVSSLSSRGSSRTLDLARVLLVHGELAPRLTLRTILQAGGYFVDVAARRRKPSASWMQDGVLRWS